MGKNRTMIKVMTAFLIMLALAVFLNWSNKSITVTEYQFESKAVPEGFDGYRITQVSDLQSEYFGQEQEKLIRKVKESRPDIIVFTGDLLDRNHTNYEAGLTAMKKLIETAPVYYVNGNHELALPEADTREMYDKLREMGVRILFDEGTILERNGSRMHLLGLSEYTLYASKANDSRTNTEYDASIIDDVIKTLTKDVPKGEFSVMLTHEPQFLQTYAESGNGKVDLIFAGHAHGGQIRLPFTEGLFAPGQGFMPKLTSGVHKAKNTTMIISRGLGNSVFPFRIFNRPEIVAVELTKER